MANAQVDDYIKKARESGMADDAIKQELAAAGWPQADIDQAFNPSVPSPQTPPPPGAGAPPPPPVGQSSSSAPPPPSTASGSSNTGVALISYLGLLVIIPLVTEYKNDQFVKFHIKQGLTLSIAAVIFGFASLFIGFIPVIGFVWFFVSWLIWLGFFVLMILGIINAAGGKMKELPIIGGYANRVWKF